MARDLERKRYTDWVSHERQKARRAVARMEREAVKSGIYKKDYDTQMQFQNSLDDFRRRTESIIATTYSKKNPDSWKDAANELAEFNRENRLYERLTQTEQRAQKRYAKGDIDTLPKPLQDKYAKYESAWEESMSMRQSHLCYEGDIREQEDLTRKLYKEYKDSVRDFLGIDSRKVIPFVREVPERGKDWNDQVLLEREDSLKATEEEETRSVASGIDLDADGEIEVNFHQEII